MSETPRRFVTKDDVQIQKLPWGPHHWLCRPDMLER